MRRSHRGEEEGDEDPVTGSLAHSRAASPKDDGIAVNAAPIARVETPGMPARWEA